VAEIGRGFERYALLTTVIIEGMTFPDWWEAPDELFRIDGHCGLVAAWVVLRYFGKRVSVPNLVEACRYTKRHGVFTVSLAAALKTHGLSVSFHSQRDAHIGGFERRCYAYARRLGIVAEAPLELSEVLRRRKRGNIPIVLFNTPAGDGHFSPLLGSRNGTLRLPLADGGKMPESAFIARWSDAGILRQCVIVGAAPRR
jgi:hypothetical protein